jgi:hypothetical protein
VLLVVKSLKLRCNFNSSFSRVKFIYMLLQSEDEDIEVAPESNEQGFAFEQNVQLPSGGFQL